MKNDESKETTAVLQSIYGANTNFYKFFEAQRVMVQEYLLGGAKRNTTMDELIFGFEDLRIPHLYDEMDYFSGGRHAVLTSIISPIFNDASKSAKMEKVGLYTGSLDQERLGKIRFVNDKDYVNKKVAVFNGTALNLVQVSPTPKPVVFTKSIATNGMQFPANLKDDAPIGVFSPELLTIFNYQPHDKVHTTDSGIFVQSYKSDDQPTDRVSKMSSGLDISTDVKENRIDV